MPIRTALVALLLCASLFMLRPRESDASRDTAEAGSRPAAALVAPADTDRDDGSPVLGPYSLAFLVAAGFVPAVVLIARRRARNSLPN